MSESVSSLSERTIRVKLSHVLRVSLVKKEFVPSEATRDLKRWLLSLHLTAADRLAVARITRGVLADYGRRARWIENELEQEVFKPYGG